MTPEEQAALRARQMQLLSQTGSGMANRAGQVVSPDGVDARLAAQMAAAEGAPPPQLPPPVQTQLGGPQERPPNPGMLRRLVELLRMGK